MSTAKLCYKIVVRINGTWESSRIANFEPKYDVIRVRVVRKSGKQPRKKMKLFGIDFKAQKKFSDRRKPNSLQKMTRLDSKMPQPESHHRGLFQSSQATILEL